MNKRRVNKRRDVGIAPYGNTRYIHPITSTHASHTHPP